jgi:uncharacterized membrane protein
MKTGQMYGWVVLQVMKERSFPMRQNPGLSRITIYAGMAVGAALGLLFGLMLLENVFIGPVVGAVVGAVAGMIWELQSRREGTD